MALRGIVPTLVENRLKALLYGPAKCGKSTCCLQFPNSYFIDTEKGSTFPEYTQLLIQSGGMYFYTQDFDELLTEVRNLANTKHKYKTLVIDPTTIIYNNLLESAERKVGIAHGKHYGEANKKFKALMNLLLRLDMNVILTAHAKNEYGDSMSVIGQTYDSYKKIDYMVDLILEIKPVLDKRIAVVKGTRIKAFPLFSEFNFSYQEISSRYDKATLEKNSTPLLLVSDKTLYSLKDTLDKMEYTEEQVYRLLSKKNLSDLSELTESQALTFINWLEGKEKREGV